MKGLVLAGFVGLPALLIFLILWQFSCKSLFFNPLFVSDHGGPCWVGGPLDADQLVRTSEIIVYGEVSSAEFQGEATYDSGGDVEPASPLLPPLPTITFHRTVTEIEVIQPYRGSLAKGDTIEIVETARPRPQWPPEWLRCNRSDDQYHVRFASRAGDRRLWFLTQIPETEEWILSWGPYSRLDIESDEVLLSTTRRVPFDREFGHRETEAFLDAMRNTIQEQGG